ncbi:hypothetical protein DSL64_27245 [Dyadobacter luteus]|uniref:Uncharacterized protein n=1 Tax=Dyadobacter luteus TaxID=2259619 RepID=A0A3D8Y678_9BACT|nr:hypothetical protein [Dyadobacter luteus]REA56122.1 hypothetical protein DSL64_27245 [Dyadobacter luteus]
MANTVVAIFDEIESARQAERYLLEKGYLQSEITLKTAVYKEQPEGDPEEAHEPDVLEGIRSFFRKLFGEDDYQVTTYHRASHNRTIVTVHTTSDDDAEHVVSVLDGYGALNVHETAGSYHPESDDLATESRAAEIKSRIVRRFPDNGESVN